MKKKHIILVALLAALIGFQACGPKAQEPPDGGAFPEPGKMSATEYKRIQFRRGAAANLPTLAPGEPGFTTDTRNFYIGSSVGNIRVHGDYVTPEMYGAKGDGVTDDTAAVQAAITAAKANSGVVLFGPKSYVVKTSLDCTGERTGMTLRGSGISATKIVWQGAGGNVLDFTNSHYCELVDLNVYCESPYSAEVGILFGRGPTTLSSGWHLLTNVMVSGIFTKASIYSCASEGNIFNNVHAYTNGAATAYSFYHSDVNGLSISSSYETLTELADCATGQVITGGFFWQNHASGGATIYFDNTDRTIMNGVYAATSGTPTANMVVANTVRNLNMYGCHQEGNAAYGVHIVGILTDATISGCLLAGTTAGIYGANGSVVQFSQIVSNHNDLGDRYNFATLTGCTLDLGTLDATVRTASSRNTFLNVDKAGAKLTLSGTSVGDTILDESGTRLNGELHIVASTGQDIRLVGERLERYDSDTDDAAVRINYGGYQGGVSRFRDLIIGDGKTADVLTVDGSTKVVTMAGAINPASIVMGSYTLTDSEFGHLDGQDQSVKTTGTPTFNGLQIKGGDGFVLLFSHQADALADDGTVNLPDATSGTVIVSCNAEAGMWLVQADGTCTKISGSTNTADTDSDTDLCVYDGGGTTAIVKNRLGAVGEIRIIYYYN